MSDDPNEAAARLPEHVAAYYRAVAGSGVGEPEGTAAWSAVRFRPYALRDVSIIDPSTTVLDTRLASPIMVAPMAQQVAAHPEGEGAMARAAAAAGTLIGISTNTAVPFGTIGAAGAPWWFQVYVTRDRNLTELMVARAVAAGARALVLTVDMMALLPASVNPRDWPEGPGKARMTNLTPAELAAAGPDGANIDPSLGFAAIDWLHELSGLPIVVKGILRADDAVRCVEHGAAGIVVSTHGGRRLGPSITSAHALPAIVQAVGDHVEVYADSGIRTGEHVAAALALGARAVFVGRPFLWALAAGGEQAVRTLLADLQAEFALVMCQLGVARVADIGPDLL